MTKKEREELYNKLHFIVVRLHTLKVKKWKVGQKIDKELKKADDIMKKLRLMKHTEGLYRIERRKAGRRLILDQAKAEELLLDIPPSQYKKYSKYPASICYREGKIELKENEKSESLCRKFGGSQPMEEDQ